MLQQVLCLMKEAVHAASIVLCQVKCTAVLPAVSALAMSDHVLVRSPVVNSNIQQQTYQAPIKQQHPREALVMDANTAAWQVGAAAPEAQGLWVSGGVCGCQGT
jgi:hypothetical protein